jgi:branched-chain amino acid transport system substrate-binding protein
MATPISIVTRVRVLVLVGLSLAGTQPGIAQAEDIVIGMSAAFKGPSGGLGTELYRGAKAYFEEINEKGGVHGRTIVIKAYDDGYNPLPAIENTVRLVEKDKVFLLFGYVGTPTVTRVLPLLKRYSDRSIVLFTPFTGAEPLRRPPYDSLVFNLRASYSQETEGLVDNFVKVGCKRIAVFYQIDAYGRSGWNGVRAALAKHGLKMVSEATYRRGAAFTQSMAEQAAIINDSKPDAVICVGSYAACGAFIRDVRDLGLNAPIANISFVGSENLIGQLQEAGKVAGRDYVHDLVNSQVVPSCHWHELAAVKEYRALMEKHQPMPDVELQEAGYHPLPCSYVGMEGFLNARLLVEVLRRLGPDLDRSRLKETVESLSRLDLGIDVPVSFGPNRHQGLDEIYYTVVKDGEFVSLADWKRWQR